MKNLPIQKVPPPLPPMAGIPTRTIQNRIGVATKPNATSQNAPCPIMHTHKYATKNTFGLAVEAMVWGDKRKTMREVQVFMAQLITICCDTRIMHDNMKKHDFTAILYATVCGLTDMVLDSDKKRIKRSDLYVHDIIRDIGALFSRNMRDVIIMSSSEKIDQ